jgi:DNA-binding SARP family transcriptional activator
VVQLKQRVPPPEDQRTSVVYPGGTPDSSVGLLGGFEMRSSGEIVPLPATVRRLVAFLALATRPLARSYVSQCLWLEATESHADGNLRSALWKIGRLGGPLIQVLGGQLALCPGVTVDYRRSVALARRLLHHPGSLDDPELDDEAFTRDLLPDWYEEWVVVERERYRQLRLHVLENLCNELVARRRFAQAVQAGLAAVAGEPLRESATLALIRVFLAEGNTGEAIRQYETFTRFLWNELGASPSSAMKRLVEGARQQ